MGEDGGRKPRRAKVRRFTAERRAAFLEHLRRTGNFTAAAKAIGLDRSSAEQRRKRDAEFAILCIDALDEANRRLAGADNAMDCSGKGAFNVIKRSRHGRMQIIRAGAKRRNRTTEEHFFAALVMCGNIAAAARAVGFTQGCILKRRRDWPAFRQRMEETLNEAELLLEFRIACMGSDVAAEIGAEGMGTVTSDCPPIEPVAFDQDFALRFLKWREEKRRGGGRRGRVPASPPIEEVTEKIVRRVAAIKRHRAREP